MDKPGFWLGVFLLVTFHIPWVSTAQRLNQKQTRGLLASLYSDYPELNDKISMDALEKVLSETLEEQLDALKTVLEESDIDIGNLDDYFHQATMMTEDLPHGETKVTNTSITGLPNAVVVQQVQATLDKQGDTKDGENSELYMAAYTDDFGEEDFDSQIDNMKVTYEGSEMDKQGSVQAEVEDLGGDSNQNDDTNWRKREVVFNQQPVKARSRVLLRQKRATLVRGAKIR